MNKLKSKIKKLKKQRNIFILTSIVLPFLTLFVTIWQIKSNEKLTLESGILNKPKSELSFGGYSLNTLTDYDILYGFNYNNGLVFHSLPFGLHNTGQKSMDKTYLIFRYNEFNNLCSDTSFKLTSSIDNEEFKRTYSFVEPFEYSTYKFSSINPGIGLGIGELIYLNETSIKSLVDVTTKDSVDMTVEYSVLYAKQFSVTLTSKDMQSNNYQFSISGISVNNMSELIFYYKEYLLNKINNSTISEIESCFLVYPEILESHLINVESDSTSLITTVVKKSENVLYAYYEHKASRLLILDQNGKILKKERLIN